MEKFYTNRKINVEKVTQTLNQLGLVYSPELPNFIRHCIELNVDLRPDWNTLAYNLNDKNLYDYSDFPKIDFALRFKEKTNRPVLTENTKFN